MTSKPHLSLAEVEDLMLKAKAMFQTMIGLTSTPREAAEMITMMHMLLWLNYGDGDTPVEDMLADYTKNFKSNYEAQIEADKQAMN